MHMSERVYQVIIGVLVLVIIVGGAIMAGERRSGLSTNMAAELQASTTPPTETAAHAEGAAPAQGDAVSVADQPAGESVAVQSVTLAKDGWVAIRNSADWTLGAAWFPAGTHADVSVPLLRATESGQSYTAALYYDIPDDHAFKLHQDPAVLMADGSTVSGAFLAK